MLENWAPHLHILTMPHRETDSNVCLRTPHRILLYSALPAEDGLAQQVTQLGYAVESSSNIAQALDQFEQRDFPLVLIRTDQTCRGLDFVERAHMKRNAAFIAITECAGCDSAIKSLRAGARDYVVWPGPVEELEHALKRAFDEVERARFREDMLSMLTHDIKIPLSSILGYSTLIFEKNTGNLSPRARDFVKIINSNGLKILQLIDNFLTSNKIDSGKLHLSLDDVDLVLFLQDLANTFRAELDRHHLSLRLTLQHELPVIEADEGLLFRAVGNLLSNACKFAPEGTEISIEAKAVTDREIGKCKQGGVEIAVSNHGPGLDPDEIPEIFERFRRGHAQGSIEGSGLGAYVLKSIVEAHGGNVAVESVPNGLTTFSVCLPFKVR